VSMIHRAENWMGSSEGIRSREYEDSERRAQATLSVKRGSYDKFDS
jgi:hypothetical protein